MDFISATPEEFIQGHRVGDQRFDDIVKRRCTILEVYRTAVNDWNDVGVVEKRKNRALSLDHRLLVDPNVRPVEFQYRILAKAHPRQSENNAATSNLQRTCKSEVLSCPLDQLVEVGFQKVSLLVEILRTLGTIQSTKRLNPLGNLVLMSLGRHRFFVGVLNFRL